MQPMRPAGSVRHRPHPAARDRHPGPDVMATRPAIAISDSANFYVSAERLFDPSLNNVPVIVLSNNDGCAIARSEDYEESN